MKSKEEMNQAWKNLSTHSDFRDCLEDLMRKSSFWRPPTTTDPYDHVARNGEREVVTYIISKLDWKELPAPPTFNDKIKR